MGTRACWCLLPLLASSACVVPGLEVGTAEGQVAGATTGGASNGGAAAAMVMNGGVTSALGGQASLGDCEDLPIPRKSSWKVAASSSSLGHDDPADPLYNPAKHGVDETTSTRWASGLPQEAGQWFHVDFGVTTAISEVTLQQGTDIDDYPRGYQISLSHQHTDFDAVASATGQGASVSEIVIPLEHLSVGRYMLVRQTESGPRWWSIAEISVACH